MERCDALVVGGGPAGAAAALALARAGCRTLICWRMPRGPFLVGESLPSGCAPLLAELGLPDDLAGLGHLRAYGTTAVWGGPLARDANFIRNPRGPGWRLDRPRFEEQLRAAATAAGSTILPAELVGAERAGAGWRVRLRGAASVVEIGAGWLLDCTGRASRLARLLGARRHNDDRLVAAVAVFRPTQAGDNDTRALVEALPEGWWYSARLPDGRRVAAFHGDADTASMRAARQPEGFVALLAQAPHLRRQLWAGRHRPAVAPYLAAANSSRLTRPFGQGWLAAGDAALAFDPLSSQGILSAIYTGLLAGRVAAACLGGDERAPAGYVARLDQLYAAYLRNRAAAYTAETRWPASPFWARRIGRL